MRIGELATAAESDVDTIRYYEKIGILPKPGRTGSNYRHYGEQHMERLRFVRRCRSLDMTLDEIRVLLKFRDAPEANCGEVNNLLDEHIGHVAARIAALTHLEKELRSLRRQCRSVQRARDCGILAEIGKGAPTSGSAKAKPKRHIAGAH
jgi:Cd(II)/Pb(II)-responsive transcriptional regulator